MKHIEFLRVFFQYARVHPIGYAWRIARDIAYAGLPF